MEFEYRFLGYLQPFCFLSKSSSLCSNIFTWPYLQPDLELGLMIGECESSVK